MTAMTHEIKVQFGFDLEGYKKALMAYLTELVDSGTAKYDQETYDRIIARAEEMVGDFVKTKTFTVSPA